MYLHVRMYTFLYTYMFHACLPFTVVVGYICSNNFGYMYSFYVSACMCVYVCVCMCACVCVCMSHFVAVCCTRWELCWSQWSCCHWWYWKVQVIWTSGELKDPYSNCIIDLNCYCFWYLRSDYVLSSVMVFLAHLITPYQLTYECTTVYCIFFPCTCVL